ncbi:MAG: DUF1540 domain-containing protein [Coriobacteriales bacterium]|nr:DUF1540 domain-containing protein [Coriobacteriales bacterium]
MDMERIMVESESPVLTCMVLDCSYNTEEICHAGHITVGDDHPRCDTYTTKSVSLDDAMPCVSKCMVTHCYFNREMDCHASGITVGGHVDHADCMTSRQS